MKIICLGDSFTYGPMVDPGERWTQVLSAKTGHTFINRGISGDTTAGMLSRLRSDVIGEHPDLALLIGGANDLICCGSADIVKNDLMAMIHQLFAAGIRPVIGTPIPCVPGMIPPLWREFTDFSGFNRQFEQLNEWAKVFSRAFLCGSVDLFTPVSEALKEPAAPETLFLDGMHLTAAGHRLIAEILKDQLTRYLR